MEITHNDNKSCNKPKKPKNLKEQIGWETRRKEKELHTWQTLIQPIIDAYRIKGIEYEFVPFWDEYGKVINKKITPIEIYKMERLLMDLCNKRPFDSFEELYIKWQNGIEIKNTEHGTFSYKEFFIEFITHLSNNNTLPHFLEFLSKEHQTGQIATSQKKADPDWPFQNPPKPIERRKSVEIATWKAHIEPIVKTHGLRKLSGERFEYHFFKKEIDEKVMHMMMCYTTSICRDIQFPKARVPADVTNDPFGGPDNFSEDVVRPLRDSEKGEKEKFIKKKKDGGEIDLRDVFRDFLENVFRDKILPEFLEMLRKDLGIPDKEAHKKLQPNQENRQIFQKDTFPPDVIAIIHKVKPAVESIYNSIKEGVGFKELSSNANTFRMEAALDYFEDTYGNTFQNGLIKKEDIQDPEIYVVHGAQNTRSVKGKLLQAIIKRHFDHKFNSAKLFIEYQNQKRGD